MKVMQNAVRALFLVQLVLGVLFWAGVAKGLVPLHMVTGVLFVIGIWVQCVLGARRGVPLGLAVGTAVWGLVVVALGSTQHDILTGGSHWLIQALHLLVGIIAIGLAERVATVASTSERGRAVATG